MDQYTENQFGVALCFEGAASAFGRESRGGTIDEGTMVDKVHAFEPWSGITDLSFSRAYVALFNRASIH